MNNMLPSRVIRSTAAISGAAGAGCVTKDLAAENKQLQEALTGRESQIQSITKSKEESETNLKGIQEELEVLKGKQEKDAKDKEESLKQLTDQISEQTEKLTDLKDQNMLLHEMVDEFDETLKDRMQEIIELKKGE